LRSVQKKCEVANKVFKKSENIICKLFGNNANELATLHSITAEQLHLAMN